MSHRLELPDDAPLELPADFWAEIKDANEITRGEKKEAENARARALAAAASNPLTKLPDDPDDAALKAIVAMSDDEMQPYNDYQNRMVRICLLSWSRGPLPVDAADFDAMPQEVYEALVLEARRVIFKEPIEFGPDGVVDPKADTDKSASSEPPSTTTPAPSETTTPTQP